VKRILHCEKIKCICERSKANWLCYSSESRGNKQEDQEDQEGIDVMADNPIVHVVMWWETESKLCAKHSNPVDVATTKTVDAALNETIR